MPRIVSWFSCGAASAVATKLALNEFQDITIAYCDTGSEHPDNKRFLKDCEKWFNKEIIVLKSKKYSDIYDVFSKTKYLVGVKGARCTTELKKNVRNEFQRIDDIQIFGFTIEEKERCDRFKKNNFEVNLLVPLIEKNITKTKCFEIILQNNIELPMMYRMGYKNNNCIGCVKGGAGYWNKIKKDFPEVFNKMAAVEIDLGISINKSYINGKRNKIFLKDLPENMGNYKTEIPIGCGVLCDIEPNE